MDFTGLLILAALYALLNLLGKAQQKKTRQKRETAGSLPPQARRLPESPGELDATQQEGSRLERMLRQFEQALEEAQSPGRPGRVPPPEEEEWEERESLEIEPEVVSLETEVRRPARQDFTQDDDAAQLVARRISAAAARDKASSRAAHAEFDQRIRQQPADKTATRALTTQQLRDAVVWREILGPPVGLREEVRGES